MARRLTVFLNQILASKTLKMMGSLWRSYWTWEWPSWKLFSCFILGNIHRSAFVMFYAGCCALSVEKKLLLVTGGSWILGADMSLYFPLLLRAACSFGEAVIPMKDLRSEKIRTYFVSNMENNLFQVLSSTVSIQAMQKLTGGQEATKIRPQGKVPHKYFKWKNK